MAPAKDRPLPCREDQGTEGQGGGGEVDLYCDLHRKCSSVKALDGIMKGRVIAKPRDVVLSGVVLRVGRAGVRQVRETGVRSVHAFARGRPTCLTTADVRNRPGAFRVRYNPHLRDEFFNADTGEAVTNLALLAVEGKTAWGVAA